MRELKCLDSFGNIDANLDDLLYDCFEQNKSFTDLIEFKRFLVIGRKGTGKTAIYRMILNKRSDSIFVDGHNLHSYPWHFHDAQKELNVPDNQKYLESWKYLILLCISKMINSDQSIPFDQQSEDSIQMIQSFIIDTYGGVDTEISTFFSPNRKLRLTNELSLKLFGFESGVKLPFEIDMRSLPKYFNEINKNLMKHVTNCLNDNHKYYLCFDELDIGFSNSDDYKNMLIGLLRAANEILRYMKIEGKKINVCVFLRDDIFKILNFEDKRKILQNFASYIDWDKDGNNTLKSLMEKRFTTLLKDEDEVEISWEKIFDETKRINGKNSKYNYICDMTCLRPRDMIDFCNNILEKYRENKVANYNCFVNDNIIEAKRIYSNNLYYEFVDEIHKHIPDYEIYFDILRAIQKTKFTYSEFLQTYKKFENKLGNVSAEDILIDLFRFSIIGNYKIGGATKGSKKVFIYKDVNNKFDKDLEIIVHQGLAPALDLSEK